MTMPSSRRGVRTPRQSRRAVLTSEEQAPEHLHRGEATRGGWHAVVAVLRSVVRHITIA